MCWLSLVVRSPPGRRSLSWIQSLLSELWLLVTEVSTLSLILLTTQTVVTRGFLTLQGKIPIVEPGIEPGTSWLVVRSSDHQTTRLVLFKFKKETLYFGSILVRDDCVLLGKHMVSLGNDFSKLWRKIRKAFIISGLEEHFFEASGTY